MISSFQVCFESCDIYQSVCFQVLSFFYLLQFSSWLSLDSMMDKLIKTIRFFILFLHNWIIYFLMLFICLHCKNASKGHLWLLLEGRSNPNIWGDLKDGCMLVIFTLSCVFHPVWCKIESRDQVTKSKAEILVINRELLCGCPAITPPLFPLLLPSSWSAQPGKGAVFFCLQERALTQHHRN